MAAAPPRAFLKNPVRVCKGAPAAVLAALLLTALTLAVYWQVGGHAFIRLDDNLYVTENPRVQAGLTPDGAAWAFTTFYGGNWHPLAWLSHMADVELFGMDAGWHHRVNLAFHLANSLLLFLVLRAMTAASWPAAFAAALFAAHPLHVESVAWVAERKDLLCTLFFLLAVRAYAAYAARDGVRPYAAVVIFFALALLSKPMAVTLPFALLLLDYWPLGRKTPWPRLLLEKAPLLAMSLAACAVTLRAQAQGGSLGSLAAVPFGARVANALVSYAGYLRKTAWPGSLAFFYPHPAWVHRGFPAWKVAGSALLLAGISVLAIRWAARRPYVAVGWFWYLGTLVPVIGLVQAGLQGMADRYAYIPLAGVFIAIAWGVPEAARAWRLPPRALALLAGAALAALAAAAHVQASYWKGDVPLYAHAVAVTPDNWLARFKLGAVFEQQGRVGEAESQYREALRIKPDFFEAQNNLANVLAQRGRADEAIARYGDALLLRPDDANVRFNLAVLLYQRGQPDKAAAHFREVLRRAPGDRMATEFLKMIAKQAGG